MSAGLTDVTKQGLWEELMSSTSACLLPCRLLLTAHAFVQLELQVTKPQKVFICLTSMEKQPWKRTLKHKTFWESIKTKHQPTSYLLSANDIIRQRLQTWQSSSNFPQFATISSRYLKLTFPLVRSTMRLNFHFRKSRKAFSSHSPPLSLSRLPNCN